MENHAVWGPCDGVQASQRRRPMWIWYWKTVTTWPANIYKAHTRNKELSKIYVSVTAYAWGVASKGWSFACVLSVIMVVTHMQIYIVNCKLLLTSRIGCWLPPSCIKVSTSYMFPLFYGNRTLVKVTKKSLKIMFGILKFFCSEIVEILAWTFSIQR